MSVKIFLEGKTDIKFCKEFIKHILNIELSHSDFINFTGKDSWQDNIQFFKINTGQEGTNLVIFDADENFEERKEYYLNKKAEHGIEFNLFLFPNNNDSGELEDLLCKIINTRHGKILECFENYEKCLPEQYYHPATKAKIYSYMAALHQKSKNEKQNPIDKNSYLNLDHWNLDHEYLAPLKVFLETFLKA